MDDRVVEALAQAVIGRMAARGQWITTAESCTGGLIASALTDVPGASTAFAQGFVTYANDAKTRALGVPVDLLARHGAVSAQVVQAMAEGALSQARADYSVAVTGIAGPGGGTPEKPVGLVYIATSDGARGTQWHLYRFPPASGRALIRLLTVRAALRHLRHVVS